MTKTIIYILTAQAIILGFGLGNALWHPSPITIGGAAIMAVFMLFTLRNVFKWISA
jgi:hypothetical protein